MPLWLRFKTLVVLNDLLRGKGDTFVDRVWIQRTAAIQVRGGEPQVDGAIWKSLNCFPYIMFLALGIFWSSEERGWKCLCVFVQLLPMRSFEAECGLGIKKSFSERGNPNAVWDWWCIAPYCGLSVFPLQTRMDRCTQAAQTNSHDAPKFCISLWAEVSTKRSQQPLQQSIYGELYPDQIFI